VYCTRANPYGDSVPIIISISHCSCTCRKSHDALGRYRMGLGEKTASLLQTLVRSRAGLLIHISVARQTHMSSINYGGPAELCYSLHEYIQPMASAQESWKQCTLTPAAFLLILLSREHRALLLITWIYAVHGSCTGVLKAMHTDHGYIYSLCRDLRAIVYTCSLSLLQTGLESRATWPSIDLQGSQNLAILLVNICSPCLLHKSLESNAQCMNPA